MSFRRLISALFAGVLLLSPAAASAAPYPPPTDDTGASVSDSRVQAGATVNFHGFGFRAGVLVTIRDSADGTTSTFAFGRVGLRPSRPVGTAGTLGMAAGGREIVLAAPPGGNVIGTTRANGQGEFTTPVHFSSTAQRGRHVLTGTGVGADGSPLTVSAVVFVEGVRRAGGGGSSQPGGGAGNGNGGGIPFTGFAGSAIALGGILLVAVGSTLLLASERRHRDRRARRVPA